jgi:tetratricopeptide (TPR) repeat protein
VSGRRRTAALPGGRGGHREHADARRRDGASWALPLSIFAIAAAVRLIVGATLWDLPLVRTPKLDSAEYFSWAARLAAGDWSWPVVAQHGPGYPIFLATLVAIGSGSLKAALALQALVGSCTAAMIASVGRRGLGPQAGWFSGLAYALYGPAVYIDTTILSESLLLFFLTVALWPLATAPTGTSVASVEPDRLTLRKVGPAVASGIALGAAALVRPTALVIAAACTVWLIVAARSPRAAWALGLACVVTMFPALAKSWSTSHALSIQGYGGLNVYIGNSPLHDGRATFRLGAGWDALNSEAARAGIADPAAQDRYYLAKTWQEIVHHPAGFAKLIGVKTLWMTQAEESRDSHSYYFFTAQSPLLRLLPRWAILFPLACLGAAAIAWRQPFSRHGSPPSRGPGAPTSLLIFYTIGAAASVVCLVVGFRYRMPLVPALAIAAGAGLSALVAAFQARRARELAALAVVAAVGLLVSHLLSDPRNTNLAEEWALTGSSLVTEHRLGEAEEAYRHALELDPCSGLAWDGLGLTLYDAGRVADARPAIERALAIDRDNARATYHLALVQEREGEVRQAADGYARALELSPFDADVATHLGEAKRKVAVQLGMAGRTAEARDEMRQAVTLLPDNGEAWLDLCLLSLDLGDRASAATALDRARAHGADAERVAFAAAALAR